MKKITKVFILVFLTFVTSGCCFSVGSIVIGKDCNKKMYCNNNTVEMDYTFNLPTSYSISYQKAVKSVVTILAHSTLGNGSSSSGSGVVINSDEDYVYIVTNRHVVAAKSSDYQLFYNNIEILFSDYTRVKATLVAAASSIDVAVIKIAKNELTADYELPIVKNSFKDINIGDSIFAVGSPLGQNHAFSASFGSVSNLYNTKVDFISAGLGYYYPIQIDASINPGNSGGGLFNSNGDLIGMIQGGRTTSTEGENIIETTGINYAIPITTVLNVANQLINTETYQEVNIGIDKNYIEDIKEMSVGDKQSLSIPDTDKVGLFVRHVGANGAAYDAGLNSHFVIESFDDISADSIGKWEMYLGSKIVGEQIELKGHYVNRPTEKVTYLITLR